MTEIVGPEGAGARIAAARKLANLTQDQLAHKAAYSIHMVRAVERGRDPASPAFIAAVARALHIEPEQLTGVAPYDDGGGLSELPGVGEMRRIIAEWDYVEPLPAVPLARLETEADALRQGHLDDKTPEAFALLPGHIRRLYGALKEPGAPAERLHSLLCNAYLMADYSATRVGLTSMKSAVLGRLGALAEQADDPLYRALVHVQRGKVLMYYDAIPAGLESVQRSLDMVSGDDSAATAIRGYGHLSAAIIAARGRDYGTARDYLGEARAIARENGEIEDPYLTKFGPVNIDFYSCAIELEAGDPGKAAQEGVALKIPPGTSPTRTGHHWQDTARAWLLTGQPDKSLKALNMARRIAPQQTRRHPSVRETVYGIAMSERRQSDSLGSFARWVGVSL